MTKNTKTLLTVAGVAVVGYLLYTQFRKKSGSKSFAGFTADDDFFNAGGRTSRIRTGIGGNLPVCGMGCQASKDSPSGGWCVSKQVTDAQGNILLPANLKVECTPTQEGLRF